MMISKGRQETRKMNIYKRETIVAMLNAALESSEYRFARRASLAWLSAFPGDMEVTLLQARAALAEGEPAQVLSALDRVCRKDPLFRSAHQLMAWASRDVDERRAVMARTAAYVLGASLPAGIQVEAWGEPLRSAYLSYTSRQYGDALAQVEGIFQSNPDLLLAQVIHLLSFRALKTPVEVSQLAQKCYDQWPDCLVFGLILAEAYLEMGVEQEAVRLIHLGAAADTTGQVAKRLWGENHPYSSLWSEDMVIFFDQPVPASVAGRLGWNQLAAGLTSPEENARPSEGETKNEERPKGKYYPIEMDPFMEVLEAYRKRKAEEAQAEAEAALAASKEIQPESEAIEDPGEKVESIDEVTGYPAQEKALKEQPQAAIKARAHSIETATQEQTQVKHNVEKELERLAKKLKQAGLSRSDGRYPVYVILSSRVRLEAQFGPHTVDVIDTELRKLAGIMGSRRGWHSIVVYPDHDGSVGQYGLLPVYAGDPWKTKHFLSDLDQALGKRGEMIGALLIIGGDSVIPFHRLPNPTEDSDEEVLSDSPYSTLDANYFVPEWPVGRLPGEKGNDAGTLLEQIRQVQRFHSKKIKPGAVRELGIVKWLKSLLRRIMPKKTYQSFGYTAAVWRRSSLAVFRPIGAPHTVVASPPVFSGKLDARKVLKANLGYYNLHGLEDSPSWYGQRDPLEKGGTPDYPVAISPDDLHKNGSSPKFIFSEACYGGHILDKSEKDSLALKFLSMGTYGVVASTCISYGSVNTPLIAADLLAQMFWQYLKSGFTAGEALMQAKVGLVNEMKRRQGYLDGEDQKTIISFVLYGDPLASYDGFRLLSKATHRYKDHPVVPTTLEENQETLSPAKVPAEVLVGVKQVVAEYLPGADVAGIQFCKLNWQNQQPDGEVQNSTNRESKKYPSDRVMVTVSKQVIVAQHTHRHFLRVTMDETGNPVKVALSR